MNEKMNEMVVRLHRTKLVPAVLSIVFGIALIIARQEAMEVVVKIAAGILIAGGVGCVLMYFFAPIKESMQILIGCIIALIGFLVWFNARFVVDLFPIIAGIVLILNGMSNIAAFSMPGLYTGRLLIIIFSVLMIAGGILILFHPAAIEDALMVYIGICYVINGLFDLIILYRAKELLMSQIQRQSQG